MLKRIQPSKDNVVFNIREDKSVYLGIATKILCLADRLEPRYLRGINDSICDFTATLYLGKLSFKKNKDSNLIPHYLPSQITETSFEGLNSFWLNEKNPNPKMPFKSIIQCKNIYDLRICEGSDESIAHQKIYYYRTKNNITLSKEQILSYFTELHKLNTSLIKNYIDSINKEEGIKAYMPTQKTYKSLLNLGILQEDMFEWGFDGTLLPKYYARLVALDYMKTQKQALLIPYFNELFYAYLVWSLKEFTIPYDEGKYQDENKLLFNLGAYKKHTEMNLKSPNIKMPNPYRKEKNYAKTQIDLFYSNIIPSEYEIGYIEGYKAFFQYYGPNFSPTSEKYLWLNLPKSIGYAFKTPNLDFFGDEHIKPSPLGNYYFELKDNQDSFVEYYQRNYPKKPPKHWSKEMMARLELELD